MADRFGIPQIQSFLEKMGIQVSQLLPEQEVIELAFYGSQGQWRIVIALQQQGEVRKLMLIAPHFGTIATTRRLECLEALMAVNYRIAMGKFGMDLEDGEVRLEEALPLANGDISFEQFQLAFGAIMQTAAMYHSLIPRIVYGNLPAQVALKACEQEFLAEYGDFNTNDPKTANPPSRPQEITATSQTDMERESDLNIHEVMAEVTRLLEDDRD